MAFTIGKLARKNNVSDLGAALLRAQIINEVVTQGIKRTVRRRRPDSSNNRSFPSGHTSGTCATATVLHRFLGWKVGVPAFAFAVYVGGSRLSENKHYLSDVVVGASLGIASGLSINHHHRNRDIAVQPHMMPGGGGVQVSIALP